MVHSISSAPSATTGCSLDSDRGVCRRKVHRGALLGYLHAQAHTNPRRRGAAQRASAGGVGAIVYRTSALGDGIAEY